jgi:hypothetical protein
LNDAKQKLTGQLGRAKQLLEEAQRRERDLKAQVAAQQGAAASSHTEIGQQASHTSLHGMYALVPFVVLTPTPSPQSIYEHGRLKLCEQHLRTVGLLSNYKGIF